MSNSAEYQREESGARSECVLVQEMMKVENRYGNGASYSQLMHEGSMS